MALTTQASITGSNHFIAIRPEGDNLTKFSLGSKRWRWTFVHEASLDFGPMAAWFAAGTINPHRSLKYRKCG